VRIFSLGENYLNAADSFTWTDNKKIAEEAPPARKGGAPGEPGKKGKEARGALVSPPILSARVRQEAQDHLAMMVKTESREKLVSKARVKKQLLPEWPTSK
jgi:hypothetical protein